MYAVHAVQGNVTFQRQAIQICLPKACPQDYALWNI